MVEPVDDRPDVYAVDTELLDSPGPIAAHVVDAERPAVVDPGAATATGPVPARRRRVGARGTRSTAFSTRSTNWASRPRASRIRSRRAVREREAGHRRSRRGVRRTRPRTRRAVRDAGRRGRYRPRRPPPRSGRRAGTRAPPARAARGGRHPVRGRAAGAWPGDRCIRPGPVRTSVRRRRSTPSSACATAPRTPCCTGTSVPARGATTPTPSSRTCRRGRRPVRR